VLKITAVRAFTVILTGGILYLCLLYLIGKAERRYLKKRRKLFEKNQGIHKKWIIVIYLLILFVGVTTCFILIKYRIRSAA
jgi:glucose-6-phosphate-specific signal transduction histidine kinase